MNLTAAYKTMASGIIRQAIADLEDPRYQEDAYHFLYNEWGRSLLRFVCHGLSQQKFDAEVSSIIRTSDLSTYKVASYARGHNLVETAEYFDIDVEDMRLYGKRHCIYFMEV